MIEVPKIKQVVNPGTKAYHEKRNELHAQYGTHNEILGERTFSATRNQLGDEQLQEALEADKRDFISFLANTGKSETGRNALAALISGMSAFAKAKDNRQLIAILDSEDTADTFIKLIRENEISDTFLSSILGAHAEHQATIREHFENEKEIEQIKAEFLELVQKNVAAGYLSTNTDLEYLSQRMEELLFVHLDPWVAVSKDITEPNVAGFYNKFVVANVAPSNIGSMNLTDRKNTWFHELAHAVLAGRKIIETSYDSGTDLTFEKSGLFFDFGNSEKGYRAWNSWLDEAVTERIAMRFSGKEKSNAYEKERDVLEDLIASGVSEKMFIEAYQENYRVGVEGESRLPKLQALLAKIREVKGDKWLEETTKQFIETDTKSLEKVEQEFLEFSRGVGAWYRHLINTLSGTQSVEPRMPQGTEERLSEIEKTTADFFADNRSLFEQGNFNARTMLEAAFSTKAALLEDETQYRLQELSNGVYVIYANPLLKNKLRPGAAGVAIWNNEKLHPAFIFLNNPSAYTETEQATAYTNENIPHEIQHLVNYAQRINSESGFDNDEMTHVERWAFYIFKDELLSRSISGGKADGYTCGRYENAFKESDKYSEEDVALLQNAHAAGEQISDKLHILRNIVKRSPHFVMNDFVGLWMKARTFAELEQATDMATKMVRTVSELEPEVKSNEAAGGWGSAFM